MRQVWMLDSNQQSLLPKQERYKTVLILKSHHL